VEALRRDWQTTTADIDASLRFGLAELSSMHVVADATALPIADSSVDAVATEPPYDPEALEDVVASLSEIARLLVQRGSRDVDVGAPSGVVCAPQATHRGLGPNSTPRSTERDRMSSAFDGGSPLSISRSC
jgi:hypothetical protein